MKEIFELITIGDSAIDLFMQVDQAMIEDVPGKAQDKICFTHGSKIPVEKFSLNPAGNALNVSVGAGLLGISTAIYSEIGDDQNAKIIEDTLKKHKIGTQFLVKNLKSITDIHTVIVYQSERTIFSYHSPKKYEIKNWPKPKWIFYSSLGKNFEEFQKEIVKYIGGQKTIGIAFNPGTLHMQAGVKKLLNILAVTDILFVNKEEAEQLTGGINHNIKNLHNRLQKLGPKMTVITNSSMGASVMDKEIFLEAPIYKDGRPVVDKTGAGDAFSSGFLAGVIYGKPLKECLAWGLINSGSVIKEIGSIHGILTKKSMEEKCKDFIKKF